MTTPTSTEQYLTRGGITVRRTIESVPVRHAVEPILEGLDQRRGALLTSSYEYPGRYTRWDLGFIDPPVVLTARGRRFRAEALNARGRVLLPALGRTLSGLDVVAAIDTRDDVVEGEVRAPAGRFTEEDRSRQPSVFSLLRALVDLFFHEDEPHLGFYGAFGYDLAFQFEPVRLKLERPPDQRDLVLYLPDELIVVDHRREVAQRRRYEFEVDGRATDGLPRDGAARPYVGHAEAPRAGDHEPGDYAALVRVARESFKRGDLFEVVPGQTFFSGSPRPPSELFRRLREWNPSPYGFLISLGEAEYLVGASPEMYVRVDGDRVETCPISGTIARGRDPIGDAAQILALLTSAKDASELTMCTDVDRNDKSRICVPGSVRVIGRRQIEMYSRLIHTVDHVEGRLLPGFDALDAFLAHTWAVTVTGAPKPWAMQFIEDHERSPRAWYGGAVGLLGFDGNLNTGLTLRTVRVKDGIAEVRVGATLLYDSDPDEEERETHLKASAFLDALRAARRRTSRADVRGGAAARPGQAILLVDHQDSFVHTLANYLRQTGAAVTTLRAGFPAGAARRPRARPGRAVAGARHAGGLRRVGHAAHAPGARHPRLRRLPRAAGHGRAFRRRARRPRLPDARQGLPHPRGRGPPVRGIAEGVFGRTLPLAVRDPRPIARRPGRDGRDRGRRGHGRGAPHPAARRRPVPSRVHPDPRRRPGPAPLAERRRDAPRVMSESSTQRRPSMLMRKLGRTGLQVAALCLGGNTFGWTTDQKASEAVLDAYLEAGGNFIDTADVYARWAPGNKGGESETALGTWMAARRNRSAVLIATKVWARWGRARTTRGLSRHHIMEGVEASLRRLQTDYIDLYQAHWDDRETPLDETLRAFDDLVGQGKVRYLGASNYLPGGCPRALGERQARLCPLRVPPAEVQPGLPRRVRARARAALPRAGRRRHPLLLARQRLPLRQVPPRRGRSRRPRAPAASRRAT